MTTTMKKKMMKTTMDRMADYVDAAVAPKWSMMRSTRPTAEAKTVKHND
jgi:hypothetical protein